MYFVYNNIKRSEKMEKEKQLTIEELEKVNGGYFVYEDDGGRFYQFVGK